jgi:hypothetical protein
MTGLYVRIERDGRDVALEIDELTDAELDQWLETVHHPDPTDLGYRWAVALAKWIRDQVRRRADGDFVSLN